MTQTLPSAGNRARDPFHVDRRHALKLLSGGLAFALSSCGPPAEEIVPYVDLPERMTPGVPLQFASALPLAGYARGVLVTSHEGRPTKVEGNPRHPASLGATDVFAQAEVMSLYDPDRSKTVRDRNGISSWSAFSAALLGQMQHEKARQGAGLRILTGRVTSPTLVRQLQALLKAFPQSHWHRYEPIHDDDERAGAVLAFGKPLAARPRLGDATILLTLDADPLGPGPDQAALARAFAQTRQSSLPPERFSRLYAAESAWRLTGANADERIALAPAAMRSIALVVARKLGATVETGELSTRALAFAEAAASDLAANPGRALVLAGRGQPPEIHALCHWINAQLKAPVDFIESVDPIAEGHMGSLGMLADELGHGQVETLIMLDSNPAYASPGALGIAGSIAKAPFSVHLGLHHDETAERCTWHLPLSHPLESWSDLRAPDGTASIVQPLIRPLYDSRTAHDVVRLIAGDLATASYDAVRATWQPHVSGIEFEPAWRRWLSDGVIPGTAQPVQTAPSAKLPRVAPAAASPRLILAIAPDPSIWEGRFANNAWLQECPKPITTQVWGNALHVSPRDATAHSLSDGDLVSISRGDIKIEAPVHIQPGQADGVLGATLGYGRRRAGAIGTNIGFDAYMLQAPESPWHIAGVEITHTGARAEILTTQHHFKLDAEDTDILPTLAIAQFPRGEADAPVRDVAQPTLLPSQPNDGSYEWAMVIDTSACIGCNACVVACQSENNVPIVGPDEIRAGRDMHWLRIDTYFVRGEDKPPGFQPVPCMHCEHAPCEPVCPVAASVHDGEGLNDQVYNRCIGTRFCQANCPYKVRRFNFFGYAHDQAYGNLGDEVTKALFNPDVTVRARGVMEKCTYCVQRISRARRDAEKSDRPIPDGGVVTACQAACPTRAISFGDLNTADAHVNALRRAPHHDALLGHLGTRPRTTYLARLDNPSPALRDGKAS